MNDVETKPPWWGYIVGVGVIFLFAYLAGLVDAANWNWFVAPYLHLSKMRVITAMGIGLLVITNMYTRYPEPSTEEFKKILWIVTKTHVSALAIGYVLHFFV